MFRAVASRDYKTLRILGEQFLHHHHDAVASILCLDHLFSIPFNIQNASLSDIATLLRSFLIYIRTLYQTVGHPDPCRDPSIQRLFGFYESSPHMFRVYRGTRLMEVVLQRRILITNEQDGVDVRGQELHHVIKQWLHDHLLCRGENENTSCKISRAFSPCVAYAVTGICRRGAECSHAHLSDNELTEDWLSLRTRVVFQQILVCQVLCAFLGAKQQMELQRYALLLATPNRITLLTRCPDIGSAFCITLSFLPVIGSALSPWSKLPTYPTRVERSQ